MSMLKYWIWLSSLSGIGPVTAKCLLDHFDNPEKIYSADRSDYLGVKGLNPKDIRYLMRKDLETSNRILASCDETGCRVITLQDALYPDRLKHIYDPPIVLYVKGNLPILDEEPVVGVVGTRNCTPYGLITAENTGFELSRHGITVVTGLALGVDTAATRGALRGGTRVVGVIGSGPDVVYPPENKNIFEDVAGSGAIISEYPPGTPAVRGNFPTRNRIISGISIGVAVIEAPKQSGALITSSRAVEQGRDVFTLPGNVDALSCEGSNALLRVGAIAFMSAADIIDEYIDYYPGKILIKEQTTDMSAQPEPNEHEQGQEIDKKVIDNTPHVDYIDLGVILNELNGDERTLAEMIGYGTLHIDEIIAGSAMPAEQVLPALTMLEIGGYAQREINGKWKITARVC